MMAIHEDPTTLTLSLLKLVTVVMGLLIVYLGTKAYRKTRRRPILFLTIGMAIMTVGAVSEGAAYQGLDWSLGQSHVFEAIVTLVAFVTLVYSLYA